MSLQPLKMCLFCLYPLSLLLPCSTVKLTWLHLLNDLLVGVRIRSPYAFGSFFCRDALVVRVQLGVYQNLRSLSTEVFPKQCSSAYAVARGSGVLPFHMQDLAFVLIEFNRVHVGTFIQPARTPPDGGPALEYIGGNGVICKVDETTSIASSR